MKRVLASALLALLVGCQAQRPPVAPPAAERPQPAAAAPGAPSVAAAPPAGAGAIAPAAPTALGQAPAAPAPAVGDPAPAAAGPAPRAATPPTGPDWGTGASVLPPPAPADPTSLLVALAPGVTAARLRAEPGFAAFEARPAFSTARREVVRVPVPAGMDLAEARRRLGRVAGVSYAEPNHRRYPTYAFARRDPLLDYQWAHRPTASDAEPAWTQVPAVDQAKVIVAVLDTGVDTTHPEFAGRMLPGINTLADRVDPLDVADYYGHGTHCAGIIGAAGDDGVGVAGLAWGAKLLPVKVLAEYGGTDQEILVGLLAAIRYRPSPDDGSRVRVINMSLGADFGGENALYTEAIAEARAAGVLVVVATGNAGLDRVGVPANTPAALAVGATATYLGWERLAHFSNHGDRLDLTAPGTDILSTLPMAGSSIGGSEYGRLDGTSMAAPYVAGVAALACARYDKDNRALDAAFVDKLRARLLAATDDLGAPGPDPYFGAGRIDAARAVAPATLDAAP